MITLFIQNLMDQRHCVQSQACNTRTLPQFGGEGLIKRSTQGVMAKLKAFWDEQRRQAEYHDAARRLHSLTDEQLRDMGITRMDIHHVVRHGKD